MNIRWIDRDVSGRVCGDYACRQRQGQESIRDDSPEYVALVSERLAEMAARQSEETILAERLRAIASEFIQLRNWARTKGYPG